MKSRFSIAWKGSSQPRKQRKFRVNAPLHVKGTFLNAPLIKDLRAKHGARTVRVSRIRVHDSLKSGRLDADLPLSRFDIVYVPRSGIGNLNVFTRQFFGEQLTVLNFALVGWELFNLDRVFVVNTNPR